MFMPDAPWYWRLQPLPTRYALLGLPAHVIGGVGIGPAPIEPGYLFFSAGHPIGGGIGTSFRGVRAGSFPLPAVYTGSGAPIDSEWLGYAGAPIGFF
jgi:hypothetical protein